MKPMYIALIIIGIALIGYGVQGVFSKSPPANVTNDAFGVKSYISNNPSFSFKYPEFSDWQTHLLPNGIDWIPAPGNPTAMGTIHMTWREISMKVEPSYWDTLPKNPQGISYLLTPDGALVFRLPGQGTSIRVELSNPYAVHGQSLFTMIRDSFSENSK
jgi:hypothetical protein